MNNLIEEDWDIEIKPQNGLFDLKLKDVWHYRDLLILMVRRDFVSFYKQTVLVPFGFFYSPWQQSSSTILFLLILQKYPQGQFLLQYST